MAKNTTKNTATTPAIETETTLITDENTVIGTGILNELADNLVAVDTSSIKFFKWAKQVYTDGGSKNSEASFAEVEKLIAKTLSDVHVKSIVNRVKKINGIVYDVYKNGLMFEVDLVTFGNIESATQFITSRTKAVTEGNPIFKKVDGKLTPTTLKIAKGAMTKAVNKAYKETCKANGVKKLVASHHRQYNNLLTDLVDDVTKMYVTEKDEEAKFEALNKMIEAFLEGCTVEHRKALEAKFSKEVAVNTTEKAPETTEEMEAKVS